MLAIKYHEQKRKNKLTSTLWELRKLASSPEPEISDGTFGREYRRGMRFAFAPLVMAAVSQVTEPLRDLFKPLEHHQ